MPKIMLVEDDNNLREIYGERLMAEGYDIVSASDGEEALALAVKEKPDLIISDVMMPKISGFDMLDILRQTAETKNTKVIMMTALSQTEDKDRADRLGADKYLVKSQVTLEDVARVVHDLIYGTEADAESEDSNTTEPTMTEPAALAMPPAQDTATPSSFSVVTPDPQAGQQVAVAGDDQSSTDAIQPFMPSDPTTTDDATDSSASQTATTGYSFSPTGPQQPVTPSPMPEPAPVTTVPQQPSDTTYPTQPPSATQPEPVSQETPSSPQPAYSPFEQPASSTEPQSGTPTPQSSQPITTSQFDVSSVPSTPIDTPEPQQELPANNTQEVSTIPATPFAYPEPTAPSTPTTPTSPPAQPMVTPQFDASSIPSTPIANTQTTIPEPQAPASYDLISSRSNDTTDAANSNESVTTEPVVNPITGEQTQDNKTYEVPTVVSSADAQSADDELAKIAQQLANFTSEDSTETKQHQEPLIEPSAQDLIHAQNQTEDPDIIPSNYTAVPAPSTQHPQETEAPYDPSVPPIIANNAEGNLEPAGARKKVIAPLSETGTPAPTIYELYEKEMAEQAANMAVKNPGAGSYVEAKVDTNPITANSQQQPSALETVDTSQIEGLTIGDDPLDQPIQQQPTQPPQAPTAPATPPPSDPNDPNSIAL